MNRQMSKRLDRLEAKIRKRQPTVLNTIDAIEEAQRRLSMLERRNIREGGPSEADQAEIERLRKLLQPAWDGAERITELELREAEGTPLTPEEVAELANLKRWCPPDPLLDGPKAIAIALKKSGVTRTHETFEDAMRSYRSKSAS
jgi:hypothetical protein